MLAAVPQAIPEGRSAHDCETEKAAETANAEEARQEERRAR